MRGSNFLKFVAGALALTLSSVGAKANVLVDGGFDNTNFSLGFYANYGTNTGDPNYLGSQFDGSGGWTITSGNVDLVHQAGGWPADPKSQPNYLDLNGMVPGSISQTFATTKDQVYSLSFYYSNNAGGAPNPDRAKVEVGSLSFDVEHYGATSDNLNWVLSSTTFKGTGDLMTLSFTQLDNCCQGGILLDSVSVAAVPEPATWAMMILGFFGMGLIGYRRRSSLFRIGR